MSSSNAPAKIGVTTATIIGMNAIIGSGIFAAPAVLASLTGPACIISYLFVVGAVWCMAISIARLASLYPQEGSFYIYTKQWAGHYGGLFAGFLYLTGVVVAMGLLTNLTGPYLHKFFPSISNNYLSIFAIIGLIFLNIFGVSLSELGQRILIFCTVFPIIATTIICFTHVDLNNLNPFMPHGVWSIFEATRIIIFGFFGFESAASLFPIVKDPNRNVPRALTYSVVIVGILYVLFITSLILAIPLNYFTSSSISLSEVLFRVFPHHNWLIDSIHISILSAITGTIHSMIWGSSSLLVSLLKCTGLKSYFHEKKETTIHAISVIIIGFLIFLNFLLIKDINQFLSITAMLIVSSFILSMITLLFNKNEWKSGQNSITFIGLITAGMIFYFAIEDFIASLWNIG